jgi:hypothetical protein
VAHTSLNVSWLEFIPLCTNSCPYSNLTVRIEVVNPFILVAFITCGCSKHMLQGASCYFIKKKKNSFLSCQSGFNHTRASVMAPSDHGLRRYAGARGPGLLPICSDPLSDEASSLPCTPVKKHPKERKGYVLHLNLQISGRKMAFTSPGIGKGFSSIFLQLHVRLCGFPSTGFQQTGKIVLWFEWQSH